MAHHVVQVRVGREQREVSLSSQTLRQFNADAQLTALDSNVWDLWALYSPPRQSRATGSAAARSRSCPTGRRAMKPPAATGAAPIWPPPRLTATQKEEAVAGGLRTSRFPMSPRLPSDPSERSELFEPLPPPRTIRPFVMWWVNKPWLVLFEMSGNATCQSSTGSCCRLCVGGHLHLRSTSISAFTSAISCSTSAVSSSRDVDLDRHARSLHTELRERFEWNSIRQPWATCHLCSAASRRLLSLSVLRTERQRSSRADSHWEPSLLGSGGRVGPAPRSDSRDVGGRTARAQA